MPTMESQALVIKGVRIGEDRRMPDNGQWTHRFQVKSSSSNRLYTIAQNKSGMFWGCNCPGWIRHKDCKHLQALGLPGHYQPLVLPKPAGSR